MSDLLKDPDAAKWRNVFVVGKDGQATGICGELLGKNSYGAYRGWKLFVGRVSPFPKLAIDGSDEESRLIVGAAYNGLDAFWGGDGRTMFGARNPVYESLMPFDGYCRQRLMACSKGAPALPEPAAKIIANVVVPLRGNVEPTDVIEAIVSRGQVINAVSIDQINEFLSTVSPGSSVTLRVRRNNAQAFITVRIGP